MGLVPILQSVVLLTLANGSPVVAKKCFGSRFATPVDGGAMLPDGRPVFGPSKTFRGIVASLLVTAAGAPVVGVRPEVGALVASVAMAGDLISSFTKRRLKLQPSSQALGLDQVPEFSCHCWWRIMHSRSQPSISCWRSQSSSPARYFCHASSTSSVFAIARTRSGLCRASDGAG